MFLKFPVRFFALMSLPLLSYAQSGSEERIQFLSEQLLLGSEVTISDAALASAHIIPEFYSRREFGPAWNDDDQVNEFINLIGHAQEEGLDPDDYLYNELTALVEEFNVATDGSVSIPSAYAEVLIRK